MERLLLRVMSGLILVFSGMIGMMVAIGHGIESDVFIYQQGFGHASMSYILDLQTSNNMKISNGDYASYASYSPDGRQLAYFSYADENLALYLANRHSARSQVLLDEVTIANVLSWSPDSSHVAILLSDSSLGQLGIVDTLTGSIQSTMVDDVIRNVLWFSEDEVLIMTGYADRDSERNYYHYDLPSDTLTLLDALTPFIDMDMSPDRQNLIGTDTRGNLWLWNTDNADPVLLITHSSIIRNPTWSATGQYVAYNVNLGNGQTGLFIYDVIAGEEREVLRGIGRIFSILFLPDDRILFIRGDVVERAINIINPDGSDLRNIIAEQQEISGHLIWRP